MAKTATKKMKYWWVVNSMPAGLGSGDRRGRVYKAGGRGSQCRAGLPRLSIWRRTRIFQQGSTASAVYVVIRSGDPQARSVPEPEAAMKIAVIGMGNVGGALGRRWAAGGHNVVFGVRDPDAAKHQSEAKTAGGRAAGVRDAVAGAEVVALTVPWGAVPDALKSAGDLSGKVLLDCTNPLTSDLSALQLGTTTSAGEEVAKQAPGAKVVKIFNTTGAGNMADTNYGT